MFFFVPETFWDRTPRPRRPRKSTFPSITNLFHHNDHHGAKSATSLGVDGSSDLRKLAIGNAASAAGSAPATIAERRQHKNKHHVGFVDSDQVVYGLEEDKSPVSAPLDTEVKDGEAQDPHEHYNSALSEKDAVDQVPQNHESATQRRPIPELSAGGLNASSDTPQANAPHRVGQDSYFDHNHVGRNVRTTPSETAKSESTTPALTPPAPGTSPYTNHLRTQPAKTFQQTLRPWNGRLRQENWLKVALRPFILFAYPAILWSTLVYSLSIGWLIVLSESVSSIYRDKETYNFSALQTGLVYLSPFIGGVLGTAVAGRVSDVIVRFMSRHNGGIYEPEFRLVMAIPVMISTCIGLMGFGWSAQERDNWAVPTVFFGVISFGCSLGSTTSITFAVDSYRQYAGEALVTLNFSKNVFHGLVFSLFFNRWLEADGSKEVFLAIGGIQIACLLTTIPIYIYGKRARMWTVRKNLMEKF